jgi:hypothetical protein
MRTRWGLAAGGALAAASIATAGCGSVPADGRGPGAAPVAAALPLATSLVDAGGTSWAVVPLGGARAQENNFWQVFVRPARTARWHLATPAGVADNGGLVVASTGTRSLVTGFRPSQDLTFSPLAVTADAGAHWSPGTLVSPGLTDVPGALAAGPGDRLIALTDGGGAEVGTRLGATWTRLTSAASLARTAAGRACGLTAITAAAFTAGATPVLAGTCGKPGTAGIFALRGGTWRAAGPALPAALADSDIQVLRLGRAGAGTTALLAFGHGAAAGVLAAWSDGSGNRWALSPVLETGRRRVRSVSLGGDGSAGLVLSGHRGETIAGPAATWTALPSLPAGTATLAQGPAGQVDALAAVHDSLTDWRLRAGVAGVGGWSELQLIRVAIPYGSSG